jgi:hypothetical protein
MEGLYRHWDQIVATDFFTVEVWTCVGLTRFVVLFFMDLSTRRVEIGGIASSANGLWMSQIARNLTDAMDGFFASKRYLIHDRDPLYTKEFLSTLVRAWFCSLLWRKQRPILSLNQSAWKLSSVDGWNTTATLESRLGLIQSEQKPAIKRSRMRRLGDRRRERFRINN